MKPIPAAAQPEYEFSIEITTGISAPPIGIISKKPIKKEKAIKIQNKLESLHNSVKIIIVISITAFNKC